MVSGPASVHPSSTLARKRACDPHQRNEGTETQLKDSRQLGPPTQKQAPWKAPGAPRPTAAPQIPCPHPPTPGKVKGPLERLPSGRAEQRHGGHRGWSFSSHEGELRTVGMCFGQARVGRAPVGGGCSKEPRLMGSWRGAVRS